jgi:hypothetical protein
VTQFRAIENYFPGRAVKEAYDVSYNALRPFELLRECEKPWAKADNYKIALRMTLSEISETDVGRFLSLIDASDDHRMAERLEAAAEND